MRRCLEPVSVSVRVSWLEEVSVCGVVFDSSLLCVCVCWCCGVGLHRWLCVLTSERSVWFVKTFLQVWHVMSK